jgi:lauroyl/myristoyl acyltransferase
VAERIGELASRVWAVRSEERWLLTERNLLRADPELAGEALREAVFATFGSYARYWVDSFGLPEMSPEAVDAGFAVEGYEHLARALAAGNGAIVVMPHLGGWEWAAFWMTQVMKVQVTAVVEAVDPPELFEFFVELRHKLGMHIVPLGASAGSEVLRALKDNHVVVLLADRDITGNGVEVDFFGERTTLPSGPVTLAMRSGAPLIPVAVYFQGSGHHAVVRPALSVERHGRMRDDVSRVTQVVARTFEEFIRAAPAQWHLQQPNWPSDYEALAAIGRPHTPPG